MKDYSGIIDFYGRGFNFADDKGDALLDYKFHICIENSCINDYWTEKFADPVLAYSVPVYAGCKNIDSYFNKDGYLTFDVNNYDQLCEIINDIITNGDKIYQDRLQALKSNRNRVMNEYNLIPTVVNLMSKSDNDTEIKTAVISPACECAGYKFISYRLRLRRLLYRYYYQYFHK